MRSDVDELAWIAEHHPPGIDPDAATTDRALLALRRHISGTNSARPRRFARRFAVRVGATATVVAGATALVLWSADRPSVRTAIVNPALYRLASSIVNAPPSPGNATLVIARTTFYGPQRGHRPTTLYSLLEDNGVAYGGATLAELRHSMAVTPTSSAHDALIAAAAESANVSPAQAAANILRALPEPKLSTQLERDQLLWADVSGILWGGAGHPDVRAGALKALATVPYVDTKATVYRGENVLRITDSRAPLGFYGPTDSFYTSATVAIDARTGDLVYSSLPGETTQFQTRRVQTPSLTPVH